MIVKREGPRAVQAHVRFEPLVELGPARKVGEEVAVESGAGLDRDVIQRQLQAEKRGNPQQDIAQHAQNQYAGPEQANDAAERLLGEGLAIDSQASALAHPYAQLLAERGALQAALQALGDIHPDAESEALRAALLHRAGHHAEAAGAYEDALREQPEQALWWTGLAIAREHNQEPRAALQAYRRAARLQLSGTVRQYVEQRMQALQHREGG